MTPCLLQHQGYMYQLNSRILKSYCKCSYSLPAAKPAVYPQICAPLLPRNYRELLYTVQKVNTVSVYNVLPKNKGNIRNSFCRLVSLVFFCWCLPYKPPTVISQHICVPFDTVSFFHSVFILMKPFTMLVRDGCHISRGKNPSGIAGNGVSTTCCTPRQGTRKAGPPRFVRSFLIFLFPKSCCTLFQTRPRLFSPHHSIYF